MPGRFIVSLAIVCVLVAPAPVAFAGQSRPERARETSAPPAPEVTAQPPSPSRSIELQYKLEGRDSDWIDATRRPIGSYQVPAGSYHFRVRARDGAGPLAEAGAHLEVAPETPFYLSPVFFSLVLVIVCLSGALVYQNRVKQLDAEQRRLGLLVDERTTQLEQTTQELKRVSTLDGLTRIANHAHLQDFLETEWRRARRSGGIITVLMVDIDDFKAYNEHFGHRAGNECLKLMARALGDVARRASDLVARYGGDEFAIVLSDTGGEGADAIVERLRESIQALALEHPRSASGMVTISIGVATASPPRDSEWGELELISAAERALRSAKRAGGNRTQHADGAFITPSSG